jgi:hypothetical protein
MTELRERRTEDAEENQEDGRRRQTHENGGETHIVAVVDDETRAASIEAWQREANTHCQKASRYQRVSELQKRVFEPEA